MSDNNKKSYEITLVNRRELSLNGVKSIDSFDEDFLELDTELGKFCAEGCELKIEEFIQASGKIKIKGNLDALYYRKEMQKKKKAKQ